MEFAKTELHLHLDGSLPPATLLKLARMRGVHLPAETEEVVHALATVPEDCRSLADYLKCFELPTLLLQSAQTLYVAADDLLDTLRADGITYAEIRFAPQLHTREGLSQAEAVQAVLRAVRDHPSPRTGVILCMMTTGDMAQNTETAALAVRYRAEGVCGLDLAGQEGARPLEEFAPLFAQASKNHVGITIHAGEACGADSVAAALELGARRIGHGTRVIEDERVLRRVIDERVTLEQCVTSNVQTQCAQSFETHPIRRLFDAGARIAVCTDNRTVSGTTLAREFEILREKLGFTDEECATLSRYAREAAFL